MFVCFFLLKGLSFGHVGSMIIGTGKIIDRSTKIIPRKEPKAKNKKKSSTKGILGEYCYSCSYTLMRNCYLQDKQNCTFLENKDYY